MQAVAPAWVAEWIGIPYGAERDGLRWNCWHLVAAVLRARWSVELPSLDAPLPRALDDATQARYGRGWVRVADGSEREGDLAVFALQQLHVGLIVAPGWLLHMRERSASHLVRSRRPPWTTTLVGTFRHEGIQ